MSNSEESDDVERELGAIASIYSVLKPLPPDSQATILRFVMERLGINSPTKNQIPSFSPPPQPPKERVAAPDPDDRDDNDESGDGISQIARKWMKRSGLTAEMLSPFFSLGLSEIDLVATGVPGATKKEKFKSVLLLKGTASYLGSGVARVSFDDLKQVSSHYDAFDPNNFAVNMKSFSKEVGGTKETGFTLTPSGLTVAAELIAEMITTPPKKRK